MTTILLFAKRRNSFQLLILSTVMGLPVMAGTTLACGPAAPTSSDAGQTATNADAVSKDLPDTAEPVIVQQASDDATPTPLPTVCAVAPDQNGDPVTYCGLTLPEPPDMGTMQSSIYYLVENAKKNANSNQARSDTFGGGGNSELHRVQIHLTAETDGTAIIAWLEEHGFAYEDERHNDLIFAGVAILMIPELSEVEGIFRIDEPITNDPAS